MDSFYLFMLQVNNKRQISEQKNVELIQSRYTLGERQKEGRLAGSKTEEGECGSGTQQNYK